MSVVLVIAVGLFFLRDNIAKFINNAATQITGQESGDESGDEAWYEINEYGFCYEQVYYSDDKGFGFIFLEGGTAMRVTKTGDNSYSPNGFADFTYSKGKIGNLTVSSDGKTISGDGMVLQMEEPWK